MILFSIVMVTSSNNDMIKVGNTFLQQKLVLDKEVGNEEVLGESHELPVIQTNSVYASLSASGLAKNFASFAIHSYGIFCKHTLSVTN